MQVTACLGRPVMMCEACSEAVASSPALVLDPAGSGSLYILMARRSGKVKIVAPSDPNAARGALTVCEQSAMHCLLATSYTRTLELFDASSIRAPSGENATHFTALPAATSTMESAISPESRSRSFTPDPCASGTASILGLQIRRSTKLPELKPRLHSGSSSGKTALPCAKTKRRICCHTGDELPAAKAALLMEAHTSRATVARLA
mmetsp:Transcript_35316/g.82470  ORF Transcript_35316/g.82470 Transcript_35316/m.82470 type:complete len:206 (-) Transcript_35316:229-846(-)